MRNQMSLYGCMPILALAALALPGGIANAQEKMPRPAPVRPSGVYQAPTRSQPKPASKPLRAASESELADAVLDDALEGLWALGDHHHHEGEYNHMINLNNIIVQGLPNKVDAFANNAWLLWSTDRGDEAIATLKKGIEANPNDYYMYDELGQHYWLHLKDPKAALPWLEKAVKFDYCPWSTWHSLAICYEKTDQWDKAVNAWQHSAKYADDLVAPRRLKQAREKLAQLKNGRQDPQ